MTNRLNARRAPLLTNAAALVAAVLISTATMVPVLTVPPAQTGTIALA